MSQEEDIKLVLQKYFDGCYAGDTDLLKEAFHPSAHVYGPDQNAELVDMNLEYFLGYVDHEPAPKDSGQPQEDEIISIDITGDLCAVARVKLRSDPVRFTDILSLVYIDGKWSIISKLFAADAV